MTRVLAFLRLPNNLGNGHMARRWHPVAEGHLLLRSDTVCQF